MRVYRKWNGALAERIDSLIALGWSQREIAAHPEVNATQPDIAKFLARRRSPAAVRRAVVLTAPVMALLTKAAEARGKSRFEVATDLLTTLGADSALLDNVLDDDVRTAA